MSFWLWNFPPCAGGWANSKPAPKPGGTNFGVRAYNLAGGREHDALGVHSHSGHLGVWMAEIGDGVRGAYHFKLPSAQADGGLRYSMSNAGAANNERHRRQLGYQPFGAGMGEDVRIALFENYLLMLASSFSGNCPKDGGTVTLRRDLQLRMRRVVAAMGYTGNPASVRHV